MYLGCKFLLRYGYLTGPNCEICALDSEDINIEEHHEVRSRYLDRTRGQDCQSYDHLEIGSCLDESLVTAELSADEDENNVLLAASLVEVVETPESEVSDIHCASPMASYWEQQILEQEPHRYSSALRRHSSQEFEPMALERAMTQAATTPISPPASVAASGAIVHGSPLMYSNSAVGNEDSPPPPHEPRIYIPTFYSIGHNASEVNARLLPHNTSPAYAINYQMLPPATTQQLHPRNVPRSSQDGSGVNPRLFERTSPAAAPAPPSIPQEIMDRYNHSEAELRHLGIPQFTTAIRPVMAAASNEALSRNGAAAGNMSSNSLIDRRRHISMPGVGRQNAFGAGSRQLQRARFGNSNTPIHILNNTADEYSAQDAHQNHNFAPGSSQPGYATNEYVPSSSRGPTVPSQDLYLRNQPTVNQGNAWMFCIQPSLLDRANTVTAVSGNGTVHPADISNAVELGVSLSEMIMSSLQSSAEAEKSASTSSSTHGMTDTVAFNPIVLAKPVTPEKAHSSEFSYPFFGARNQASVNNSLAHNNGTSIPRGTPQTNKRALDYRVSDRAHSSTHLPVSLTASYSIPPVTDSRQSQTTLLQQSRPTPMNCRHNMPAGIYNRLDAMHPRIAHARVPNKVPERMTGTSIRRVFGAQNNVMPPSAQVLAMDTLRAPPPRSRPSTAEVRSAPGHNMVSKESWFSGSSTEPNASYYSGKPLMASEHRKLMGRPLTERNSYQLVRDTSNSKAPMTRRMLQCDNTREMSQEERVSCSRSSLWENGDMGRSLQAASSATSEIRATSTEQVMSDHLYARREPKTAEPQMKRITQSRKTFGNTPQQQGGAALSPNAESFQEVVMTPLAKRLYTTEESRSIANPPTGPTPVIRGISDGTSYGINHRSEAAPTREPQYVGQEPPSRTWPEQSSSSGRFKRPYQLVQGKYGEPCQEIIVSPLVKKLRTARETVLISKPIMTSRDFPAKAYAPSPQTNRTEPVVANVARHNPVNSAMPDMDDETVNPLSPETPVNPAVTANSGHLVPWSPPSTKTLSVDQGLNLRPQVEALPPFESISGYVYPRIREYSNVRTSGNSKQEDIRNIVEWLMHSETTSDKRTSLLPITSGDPECSGDPAQQLIRSEGSGVNTGDLEDANSLIPVTTTHENSAISTSPDPVSMIQNSADHTGPSSSITSRGSASMSNDEIERCSTSGKQTSFAAVSSDFQKTVASPRNRRKSTIPRRKRPRALKPPTTGGKIAKSPTPPSKKSIEHFIVVCGGEAFRVSSRVLEEASPVVRDFSKKCLQAGPNGDCIFEVVGVTPWAMHELLKYLCRTSYNRPLMRSAYMKKLAEKLKINLDPTENPRDIPQESS